MVSQPYTSQTKERNSSMNLSNRREALFQAFNDGFAADKVRIARIWNHNCLAYFLISAPQSSLIDLHMVGSGSCVRVMLSGALRPFCDRSEKASVAEFARWTMFADTSL